MQPLPIDAIDLLDIAAIDRVLVAREGLRTFVELAWHVVEAVPFIGGRHIDEICKHLEAVSRGEIKRLIINVPPGCSKSLITSVFWPAFDWITHPSRKWMFATFDARLANRDALRCRQLVSSAWFQERWGGDVGIYDGDDKQRTMGLYHTLQGGMRYSTTAKGGATGHHAHIQVVDDPTKVEDVRNGGDAARAALERTSDWWRNTMASRKADPKDFARVIIMQRLHEDDLAGACAREGGWEMLRLPMRFEADSSCLTSIGGDWRTSDGELLCPERFDEESVTSTEREMGSMTAAAQLQQRPAPAAGAIFKREWLAHEYEVIPDGVTLVQSWDCAFKGADTSDYVVGQVWGCKGGVFYLVDQIRARMTFPETLAAVRALSARWPKARAKYVEDKANGAAVIATLCDEVAGIIAVNPDGGKEARANAVAPYFEAGNVRTPRAAGIVVDGKRIDTSWILDWREEMAQFPKGRHDDQVDATTQALTKLAGSPAARFAESMRRAKEEMRR